MSQGKPPETSSQTQDSFFSVSPSAEPPGKSVIACTCSPPKINARRVVETRWPLAGGTPPLKPRKNGRVRSVHLLPPRVAPSHKSISSLYNCEIRSPIGTYTGRRSVTEVMCSGGIANNDCELAVRHDIDSRHGHGDTWLWPTRYSHDAY